MLVQKLLAIFLLVSFSHGLESDLNMKKLDDEAAKPTVIWTSYSIGKNNSKVYAVPADPDVIESISKSVDYLDALSPLLQANNSYFKGMAGDEMLKKFYFVERSRLSFTIYDMKTNEENNYLQGIGHYVECVSYDWPTGNVYWVDSSFNWIMVADSTLKYYTPILLEKVMILHSLVVHTKQRKLFAVTGPYDWSRLYSIDLSGKNKTVLVESPKIAYVSGLAIDYDGNKLFWVDRSVDGSVVAGSNMDGSNVTVYLKLDITILYNLAIHNNFLYITDQMTRSNPASREKDSTHFMLWVLSSTNKTQKPMKFNLRGLPYGIMIMNGKNRTWYKGPQKGDCNDPLLPACEHICLPRINATRECACSMGFQKQGDNRCVARRYQDEFLYYSDKSRLKIIQIPFNYSTNNTEYTFLETNATYYDSITAATANPITAEIYWTYEKKRILEKEFVNGTGRKLISSSTSASSLAIDPFSNNLFFLDESTQSIKVMDSSRVHSKTLFKINPKTDSETGIAEITLDLKSKKLYWTNPKNQSTSGEVWRMNFDGTGKELVFGGVYWPRGITIDHSRGSIFVSDFIFAMVFEQPLDRLKNITNTSLLSIEKQYDLSAHLPRFEHKIKEIAVYKNFFYFTDKESKFIERFDLEKGPASVENFGPKGVFSANSLSIFSRNLTAMGIDDVSSACTFHNKCEHICVDNPHADKGVTCLCDDDSVLVGEKHCMPVKRKNAPPSFGTTCPENMDYELSECEDQIAPKWTAPTWTDDHTPSNFLKLSQSSFPPMLSAGIYEISYTATDHQGLSATCLFTVVIREIRCRNFFPFPDHLIASNFTCSTILGSTFTIACRESNHLLLVRNQESEYLLNFCSKSGHWVPADQLSHLRCIEREKWEKKNSFTLKPKNLVLIIVAMCIVILILAFLVLMFLRRGSPSLIKISFPKFWRRKADTQTIDMTGPI